MENKEFVCTKSFLVDKYDEYDTLVENEYLEIKEGTIWRVERYHEMTCFVDLKSENGWLNISEESLMEYFEEKGDNHGREI